MRRLVRNALLICIPGLLGAQALPPGLEGVGIEQRLNHRLPLDSEFVDESGRRAPLGAMLGQRPAVLALVYYECPMLCNLVLNGVLRAARAMSFTAGKEYDIIAVSFDPRETPALARRKHGTYTDRYGRPEGAGGWRFLTGDEEAIARLTDAVGFRFRYDPVKDDFAHASGIVVVTPEGRVSRYLFGVEYSARDLRLALVEASREAIGNPVDQFLLFCFHYDPAMGKYSLAIRNVLQVLGVATVLGLVALLAVLLRRERRLAGLLFADGRDRRSR